MYRVLKSTTSLTMCLALALPTGGFAQSGAEACATDGSQVQFPCVLADGTEVTGVDQLLESIGAEATETTEQPAQAEAQVEADMNAGDEAQAASDAAAEAQAAAAEAQAAADENANAAAAAAEAEATAAAQAANDEAAAAAQAAEDEAAAARAAEIEAQIAADAQADADAAAAAEAAAQNDAAAADAETDATADAQTDPAMTEETDQAATEETPAETAAETDATPQAQTEAAPQAEAETAETTEQPAEAAPTEETRTEEQIAADLAEQQAAEEARAEQRAAEAAAAAQAAAAADSGDTEAEVITEEVTEEDTRTSSEEFETAVTGQADAQASNDDDDGLSNFEKALIVGLGAVAVGAVLNNGSRVVSNSGDRLVVEDPNGDLRVLKDDTQLVRQAGDQVRRENFNDGSSRTIVTKPDGSQVITIQGRDGTVLRRVNVDSQGNEYVLFDDTQPEERIVVNELPQVQQQTTAFASQQDEEALRAALQSQLRGDQARTFSLRQIRDVQQVRALAPEVELDAVRFATGSAAIQPEQARALAKIGTAISEAIANDPRTVILVEGHTDAVGDAGYNLALSDRRAETVALALTEYFNVPASNLITQGYGEAALKVPTQTAEPANRRAVVRNITGLLRNGS